MNILEQIAESEQHAAEIRADAAAKTREISRLAERDTHEMEISLLEEARTKCEQILAASKTSSSRAASDFLALQAENNQQLLRDIRVEDAVRRVVEGVLHP